MEISLTGALDRSSAPSGLLPRHGTVEAPIGKKKVSTKLVGAPTSLGPLVYQLSRNENILKGKF